MMRFGTPHHVNLHVPVLAPVLERSPCIPGRFLAEVPQELPFARLSVGPLRPQIRSEPMATYARPITPPRWLCGCLALAIAPVAFGSCLLVAGFLLTPFYSDRLHA